MKTPEHLASFMRDSVRNVVFGVKPEQFFLQGIEGFYVIYACSLSFGTSSVNRIPYTAPLWIY